MKKLFEKLKSKNQKFFKIAYWCMIITIFSSIIVYSYGEYWFNQFLKTEFMQSKIWEVANKEIENSAFCGIKNSYQRYETEHFIIYYKTDDLYFLQKIARRDA